jgi:hypothetical protein
VARGDEDDDVPNGRPVNQYGGSTRDLITQLDRLLSAEIGHERETREREERSHHALHQTAERNTEARLERLNELRKLVEDIQHENVSREYFDSQHGALAAEIKLLRQAQEDATRGNERRISNIEGRFGGVQLTATALGAVAIVVAASSAFLALAK